MAAHSLDAAFSYSVTGGKEMTKDTSPPAFPVSVQPDFQYADPGMSLRDYFAGQALVGLLASGPHDCGEHGLAHDAYLHADAMLAYREENKP